MVMIVAVWMPLGDPGSLLWATKAQEALRLAQHDGRAGLVLVTMPRCAACQLLQQHTLQHRRVRRALKPFALALYELEEAQTKVHLQGQDIALEGTPTLLFVRPDGYIVDEPRLVGFVTPNTLLEAVARGSDRFGARSGHPG